jgi:hypothetical protein
MPINLRMIDLTDDSTFGIVLLGLVEVRVMQQMQHNSDFLGRIFHIL